jgi:hypothetical protein
MSQILKNEIIEALNKMKEDNRSRNSRMEKELEMMRDNDLKREKMYQARFERIDDGIRSLKKDVKLCNKLIE